MRLLGWMEERNRYLQRERPMVWGLIFAAIIGLGMALEGFVVNDPPTLGEAVFTMALVTAVVGPIIGFALGRKNRRVDR